MIRAADNPFAPTRTERLLAFDPAMVGTTWDEIWDRWEECGRRGAVIGRHGSGKTTFSDAWKGQMDQRGVRWREVFLNGGKRVLSAADWDEVGTAGGDVILLDGGEQVGFWTRRKLDSALRGAGGFVEFRHRAAKLPIILELKPEPGVMIECVRRVSPHHVEEFAAELPVWWKQSRGNIREILLRCYDAVARGSA